MKQTSGKRSATGSQRITVLYDGWPLVFASGSPAALHIQELLSTLPGGVDPCLALPSDMDLAGQVPDVRTLIDCVPDNPHGRLGWEQGSLPRLARQSGARLLHTTGLFAPLLSPVPCLVSPAEALLHHLPASGFVSRLRASINIGGQSLFHTILWPADLPDPPIRRPVRRLPPLVHSAFYQTQPPQPDFPDDFIFCPGPLDEAHLQNLLAAWERVAVALGENWALLVSGLGSLHAARLRDMIKAAEISGPVEVVDLATPARRAAATQQARLVLAAGSLLPWGDGTLHALACARPLAAPESAWRDSRVGPAGYLAPSMDARALAAAILTPLVEEPVSQQLSQAAAERSAGWQSHQFPERLWESYQGALPL